MTTPLTPDQLVDTCLALHGHSLGEIAALRDALETIRACLADELGETIRSCVTAQHEQCQDEARRAMGKDER